MITRESLLKDLIVAYRNARRRIRKRSYQLEFEMNMETNLVTLRDEIWERRWKPQPSDVFIVFKPVQREVFAAQFRDKVVHHLLYNYLLEMMERIFIRDSYSCRKGKGTRDAISRLQHHLLSVTHSYQRPAYILKLDLRGYFMSINKAHLEEIIHHHLDRHWEYPEDRGLIDYLLHTIIFNDVREGCRYRCRKEDWNGLPKTKSLFCAREDTGLPIGDLTSQLFSNIYLNEFDQYVKRTLKCRHYGRYVDDFYVVDTDMEYLKNLKQQMEAFLGQHLGVVVHPHKVILQPADWPIAFLGQYICPHYKVPSKRFTHHFIQAMARENANAIRLLNDIPYSEGMDELIYAYLNETGECEKWQNAVNRKRHGLERMQSVVNSYFGFMKGCKAFHLKCNEVQHPRSADTQANSLTKCIKFRDDWSRGSLYKWYKYKYIV